MDKQAKKPRKAPRWGVRPAAIAFCVCGWHGAAHMTKGCFKEAHSELLYHRQRCVLGGKVRDDFLRQEMRNRG